MLDGLKYRIVSKKFVDVTKFVIKPVKSKFILLLITNNIVLCDNIVLT